MVAVSVRAGRRRRRLVLMRGESFDRASAGFAAVVGGGILASYGLAGLLSAGAAAIARLDRGVGSLAATGIERSAHRVWATVMAVAVAVVIIVTVAGTSENVEAQTRQEFDYFRRTDLWVGTVPADQVPLVGLPENLGPQLANLRGVERVVATAGTTTIRDGTQSFVFGYDGPSNFFQFAQADDRARSRTLAGESVIATHQYARTHDLEVGDQVTMQGPGGTLRLPLADVVTTTVVAESGSVHMSIAHFRRIYRTAGNIWYELQGTPGADITAVRAGTEDLTRGQPYPSVIESGDEAADTGIAAVAQVQGAVRSLIAVIVIVAGLAVFNTMVASVLERWRELGVLRAVGTTRRQLTRVVGLEACGVGAIGGMIGCGLGVLLHWGSTSFLTRATPNPVRYQFEPDLLIVAVAAAGVVTVAGTLGPALRAAHMDVRRAIS